MFRFHRENDALSFLSNLLYLTHPSFSPSLLPSFPPSLPPSSMDLEEETRGHVYQAPQDWKQENDKRRAVPCYESLRKAVEGL